MQSLESIDQEFELVRLTGIVAQQIQRRRIRRKLPAANPQEFINLTCQIFVTRQLTLALACLEDKSSLARRSHTEARVPPALSPSHQPYPLAASKTLPSVNLGAGGRMLGVEQSKRLGTISRGPSYQLAIPVMRYRVPCLPLKRKTFSSRTLSGENRPAFSLINPKDFPELFCRHCCARLLDKAFDMSLGPSRDQEPQ